MKIFIGCCGFPVNKKDYFKNFDVVELQQTFYQPPERIETVKKWRDAAPKDFEFTLKVWQLITHSPSSPTYRRLKMKIPENKKKNYGNFKPTDEVFSTWNKMNEIASILNSKIIIFQCPASFLPTDENKNNIRRFFNNIERKNYTFAWEPRGEWHSKGIREICEELNLVHCVDPFKNESVYGGIKYYRLHGKDGYKYEYTDNDVDTHGRARGYLQCLKNIIYGGKSDTYIMFNNTNMYKDALKLKKLLT